ncbi:hypothetical protein LH51_01845 [Nitrincola sp. A-D6]|uniref:hypothetical protein n=1 Tax=Nitrincola sp. A-D6 TaxID=1545442 RepID=UPI00051FBB1A|nr:hypothetical protein [Nitrincola sp. A-D6]KGK43188.1 hypothetical protein LH51_01845 [Nitrincola sp. A-D6]
MSEVSAAAVIETVMPDDGKRESLWVWLLIAAVLLLGALGIWLRQEVVPQRTQIALSPSQSQQLMSLSIAREEIQFLAEKPWPAPESLESLGLELFASSSSHRWHQPGDDCYQWISRQHDGDFLLRISDAVIFYHPGEVELLSSCTPDEHWTLMDN